MKKIFFAFALSALFIQVLPAQKTNRSFERIIDPEKTSRGIDPHTVNGRIIDPEDTTKTKKATKQPAIVPNKNSTAEVKVNTDSIEEAISAQRGVLYKTIVRKNGWIEGVGQALSEEDAKHLHCYFKLSQKNKAGHWTLVEAFNGRQEAQVDHQISLYEIVSPFDETDYSINDKWKEKLQSICKWHFISDASGEEVVQERLLNAQGIVVCIFTPTKIDSFNYIGGYTDKWGHPISLRSDYSGDGSEYANIVQITRDNRGYDTLYTYYDRSGHPRKNKDGIYRLCLSYDNTGRQISASSLTSTGKRMTHLGDYCGWKREYVTKKKNRKYFDTYLFDENGNHTKAHSTQRFPYMDNTYGYRFLLDKYGRDTAVYLIDSTGKKVNTPHEIQRYVKKYTDYGEPAFIGVYDSRGVLLNAMNGVATRTYDYDEKGNLKLISCKDSIGQFVNCEYGYCSIEKKYNSEGKLIQEIHYTITDSINKPKENYKYICDASGNEKRTWFDQEYLQVDSVDSKKRNICTRYFNLQGDPINKKQETEDESLYHAHITRYDDEANTYEENWYDIHGNLIDGGYSTIKYSRDTNTETLSQYTYNKNQQIIEANQSATNTPDNSTTPRWSLTEYGERARVGWDNYLYYKCLYENSADGETQSMIFFNEFDEPAYLSYCGTPFALHVFSWNEQNNQNYDENGIEIDEIIDFTNHLPRVFCIEITDTSIAYPLGLRNGDIILSYGDWTISEDLLSNMDYFYLETITKADKKKNMIILRHFPEEKRSEVIHLDSLPAGCISSLGFYPHMIYYTQKEKERLLRTCASANIHLAKGEQMEQEETILIAIPIKGRVRETRLYHDKEYNLKDPGVVLYLAGIDKMEEKPTAWKVIDSVGLWSATSPFSQNGSTICISPDIHNHKSIHKLIEGDGGMHFVRLTVNHELYEQIRTYFLENSLDIIGRDLRVQTHKTHNDSIRKKQLYGIWEIKKESNTGRPCTIQLELCKKNIAHANVHFTLTFGRTDSIITKLHVSLTYPELTWSLNKNSLTLGNDYNYDFELNGVEVSNCSEDIKNEYISYYQNYFKSYKRYILEYIYDEVKLSNILSLELDIEELTQNEIFIKGYRTPLKRIKK